MLKSVLKHNYAIITINEDIDSLIIDKFEEEIKKNIMQMSTHNIIIDLSKINFIVSRAIGIIVKIFQDCEEHRGKLVLSSPQNAVKRVLEITKINEVIPTFNSIEEAEEYLNQNK